MRTVPVLAVIFVLTSPLSSLAQALQVARPAASLNLACFSPQQAFAGSPDGKAALERLSTVRTERARAIDERNQALRQREQALEANAAVLSDAAKSARRTELERFRLDVQRFIEDAQTELMGLQKDAETAFLAKLRPVVEKIAHDKGLQIIFNLDLGQIAWFDPSLDITADVVKGLAGQ